MAMNVTNIATWFEPKKVDISNIYLDPNNPRFLDLYKDAEYALDLKKIEKVQNKILDRMENGEFEIAELKKSIIQCGFLPIDRIVVIQIPKSNDKYVVIEGNRRIAAIMSILSEPEFHDDIFLENLKTIEVLVLKSPDEQTITFGKQIVQGIRNVSGIKNWRPYQQAQLINNLIVAGQNAGSIAKMIGMSTSKINRLYKTFKVLNQMREDEEYSESWHARLFAYFDQIMGRHIVREWLGWDANELRFKDSGNLKLFYSWIVERKDDDDNIIHPKISDHRLIKYLEKAVSDPDVIAILKQEGKKIEDIIPLVEKSTVNLHEDLKRALKSLEDVSIDRIEDFNTEDIRLLNDLVEIIKKRLTQHGKLK